MNKQATWVGSATRSKQYYALRDGFNWQLSSKTRHPVNAMKECWGEDLDVVTMLALEPQPITRDWTRFNEAREIVDLGRNEREARRAIKKLTDEAIEESDLQNEAGDDGIEAVLEKIEVRTKSPNKMLAQIVSRDGLFGLLGNYLFNQWAVDAMFANYLGGNDELLGRPFVVERICEILESAADKLVQDTLHNPPIGNYIGDVCATQIHHYAAGQVHGTIMGWLEKVKTVHSARVALAARQLEKKPLDKELATQVSADSIRTD